MQRVIFTEQYCQPEKLFPFSLTRRIQDIRIGILTIREKWELMLKSVSYDQWNDDYKDNEKSIRIDTNIKPGNNWMIHSNVLPTKKIIRQIKKMRHGQFLTDQQSGGIAFRFSEKDVLGLHKIKINETISIDEQIKTIQYPWDLFALNDWAIRQDFELITSRRKSQPVSKTNSVINRNNIFIEKGASVQHSILNADAGPIYIGRNAVVMEGCMIRGPFALCEGAVLKMGTRVYGATTLGPYSVGGGEIKNSVLFGYSNKAHDGYLGDSVLGEWCNLGAGTTNSNLKNNVSIIQMYNPSGEQVGAGKKCGLIMGDYSRSAINTSFNTGTIVGVGANVFGKGLTPKFIPNFSWGTESIDRYDLNRSLMDIDNWKQLKNHSINEREKHLLKYIYEKF